MLQPFTGFASGLRKPIDLDWSCCRVLAVTGPGFGSERIKLP